MGVALEFAAPASLGHALGDPFFEIGDRIRADAEFDQMQLHRRLIADRSPRAKRRPVAGSR
jgi:hypothetical protein